MKPLISGTALKIRRWCEHCGRFTASRMAADEEICAEHDEPEWDDE